MDMVDLKLVQICQEMFAFVALVLKKSSFWHWISRQIFKLFTWVSDSGNDKTKAFQN